MYICRDMTHICCWCWVVVKVCSWCSWLASGRNSKFSSFSSLSNQPRGWTIAQTVENFCQAVASLAAQVTEIYAEKPYVYTREDTCV